ncbi:MAG: ribbon-helix-helix domain-containing protein [archaeon]
MVTTMSFTVEEGFVKRIENIIKTTGLYHSKSEFLRDAAREKLTKLDNWEEHFKRVRAARISLQKKARFQGYLTHKQREKLARDWLESR